METLDDQLKTGNEKRFIERVRMNNKVIIASDESYHPEWKVGTRAQIITTKSLLTSSIFRDNIIPGSSNVQCSYQSKLGSLIGAIHHWN